MNIKISYKIIGPQNSEGIFNLPFNPKIRKNPRTPFRQIRDLSLNQNLSSNK